MKRDWWQQLEDVFRSALERRSDEREALLDERCAGDELMRAEVASLLGEHERLGDVLDRYAPFEASGALSMRALGLVPGARMLHYQVVAPLGQGGMGVVFRARDLRLEREVAIKILPPQAGDAVERAARLQQEARAVSALSHPNILTIHEIGEWRGHPFIVTELVEGQTLAQRIAARPLDAATLLDVAVQITDAVAEAHRRGIIHRDLKPQNLMVTARGTVKVLDFGLAKLIDADATPSAQVPIEPGASKPARGILAGTVPYMSPEQTLGHPLDARSDVFSLGVVLYELATGALPFRGTTVTETLLQTRTSSPKPPAAELPRGLWPIIARCLEKEPERRHADARALHAELQRLRDRHASFPARRRFIAGIVLGTVAVVVTGAVVALRLADRAALPALRNIQFSRITKSSGDERYAAFSPDGRWFVFARPVEGHWKLFRRARGGAGEPDLALGPASASSDTQPAVSPDGRSIVFRSTRDGGGLFIMGAGGETERTPARRLVDRGEDPAWSTDGTEIAYSTAVVTDAESLNQGDLFAVSVVTGERRLIAANAAHASYSPHGKRIAYFAFPDGSGRRDIYTMPARGGAPVAVTDDDFRDWNPTWAPDGRALFFVSHRDGRMNIWRVPIDEDSGRPLGPPEALTAPSDRVVGISLAPDGRRLIYSRIVANSNIERVSFDPVREVVVGAPVAITRDLGRVDNPTVSPDGQWLVVRAWGATATEDLWIMRVDGTERRPLMQDVWRDRGPRWSPDGKRIAFYSDRGGRYEIWTMAPDGTQMTQRSATTGAMVSYPVWAPDGRTILYTHRGAGTYLIDSNRAASAQAPIQVSKEDEVDLTPWSFAPDGDRAVGWMRVPERSAEGVGIFSISQRTWRVLTPQGSEVALFMRDGRRVLSLKDDSLYLHDSETGKEHTVLAVAPDRLGRFCLAPDERAIYYSRLATSADLWLAELPQ